MEEKKPRQQALVQSRITPALKKKLQKYAWTHEMSESVVMRMALQKFLARVNSK